VPPAAVISAATALALPPERSTTATLASWAARWRDTSAPIPWPPPVTTATLCVKSGMELPFLNGP
jgi:hypothetical protein